MTSILRIAYALRAWGHWRGANRRIGCQVEQGFLVSPKASIAPRAIIRRGTEVGPDVSLGAYSYISGPRSYVESARIGKFCSIARQVVIGASDHDLAAVSTHPFRLSPAYGGLAAKARPLPQKPPPVIGNDVWIGMNAVICRGVTVGHGAVVASNAVVTRDVAPYTIVGGTPATVLKSRLPPAVVEALLRIRWWDWPDEVIAQRLSDFDDPQFFVQRYDPEKQLAHNDTLKSPYPAAYRD